MTNTTATDSIRILATRTGLTRHAVRAAAIDLGLNVAYDSARKTYVIAEPAATVVAFNALIGA